MNSLPRWFVKKDRKKESFVNLNPSSKPPEPPIDEVEVFNCRPNSGLSYTSDEPDLKEENLYVNGQVPRGHFTEYFMSKESLEEVPELYPVQEFGDRKSLENLSTNIISTENGLNFKESSGLEQVSGQLDNQSPDTPVSSVSQDKFNFGSPNQVGLPSPEIGTYYNVQLAHRARSTVELPTPDLLKFSRSSISSSNILLPENLENNEKNINHLIYLRSQRYFSQSTLDIKDVKKKAKGGSTSNIIDNNYDEVGVVQDYLNSLNNGLSDSDILDSGDFGSQDSGAVFLGGNHYGTPRPSGDSSVRPEVAPGQHPSSEGKRRRNRSNVEAMASKHLDQDNNGGSPDSGVTDQSSLPKAGNSEGGDEEGLGPLPPNWEKAYTDKGEQYFIDHNSGTSHWLDPRLSRVQKQRAEDCEDNELPFGWERIDDPHYGTYYIDHVNRRTQYENPVLAAKAANQSTDDRPFFTRDPGQLRGEKLQAKLVKSSRGLGFTIVGGDDSEEEFLQIKSVVPNGPAWLDGRLKTGDVLVFVNGTCVLGFTHHDMVTMFQNINPGEVVKLDVCRGYPLPFDPDDPNTEIVTTVAVNSPDSTAEWNLNMDKQSRSELDSTASMPDLWRSHPAMDERPRPGSADLLNGHETFDESNPDQVTIPIVKGGMGFGFTIADSAYGQKVKKILDRPRCKSLHEGDILVEINAINVSVMNHNNVVQVLKDCPRGQEAAITIQRGYSLNLNKNKFKKKGEENGGLRPKSGFLFRSKTPTAELFMSQEKEIVPIRPKTPVVDTRNMAQKNWNGEVNQNLSPFSRNDITRASLGVGGQHGSFDMLADQLSITGLKDRPAPRSHSPGRELDGPAPPQQHQQFNFQQNGYDSGYGYSGYNGEYPPQMGYSPNGNAYRAGSLPRPRKDSSSFERRGDEVEMVVVLLRHDSGFGFRIVGGTEEGSQVSIGHIVPGGAADMDGRLFSGDEIVAVDNQSVMGASHHVVVGMMGGAAQRGQVQITIRRRQFQEGYRDGYPYDVTVSRLENEGFGFVIISSVSRAGSTIGRIIPGSPAERCGRLQVGDRILAVNHVDINSLHHEKIINIIKESGYSVTLTVGPPIDDSSSTASTSHREDQEVGAHLGEDDQYFAVELGRGNRGFGFSIRGGREFHSMPLFVLRMAVDGPAAADGRLRVGDQLIEINSQSTRNMTHAEAIETIKSGGATVRLLVKRGKVPPPAMLDQTSMSPTSATPLPQTRPVSSLSQPNQQNYHASNSQPYSPNSSQPYSPNSSQPYMPANSTSYNNTSAPAYNTSYTPSSPGGNGVPPGQEGGVNGPVSHSSPRYPPHQYFQQPYWGYHQQSVE